MTVRFLRKYSLSIDLRGISTSSDETLSPFLSGIVMTYLREIFRVLVIGFRRYPILAAVYINSPLTLICATLYTWLDFAMTIVQTSLCRNDFYPDDGWYDETRGQMVTLYLTYYGLGTKLLLFQMVNDVPRYFFLSYISVKLPLFLWKRLRQKDTFEKHLTREQKTLLYSSLPHSAEARYVRRLFGMDKKPTSSNRFVQVARYIYTWRDDFRFSSRVVCVYSSIFLLLFFVTVKVSALRDMFEEISRVTFIF